MLSCVNDRQSGCFFGLPVLWQFELLGMLEWACCLDWLGLHGFVRLAATRLERFGWLGWIGRAVLVIDVASVVVAASDMF